MSNIDDLSAKVRRLEDQLVTARGALCAAMIASCPVKVGTIYVDRKGRRGQVVQIGIHRGAAAPIIALFKKDGTPGSKRDWADSYHAWKPEVE